MTDIVLLGGFALLTLGSVALVFLWRGKPGFSFIVGLTFGLVFAQTAVYGAGLLGQDFDAQTVGARAAAWFVSAAIAGALAVLAPYLIRLLRRDAGVSAGSLNEPSNTVATVVCGFFAVGYAVCGYLVLRFA